MPPRIQSAAPRAKGWGQTRSCRWPPGPRLDQRGRVGPPLGPGSGEAAVPLLLLVSEGVPRSAVLPRARIPPKPVPTGGVAPELRRSCWGRAQATSLLGTVPGAHGGRSRPQWGAGPAQNVPAIVGAMPLYTKQGKSEHREVQPAESQRNACLGASSDCPGRASRPPVHVLLSGTGTSQWSQRLPDPRSL